MNGTWKENVGGWNHKDTRRKRQNRNHTLNDNGYYFSRKEPAKSVRYESEVEHVPEVITKHGETRQIYKIKLDKGLGLYSYRLAYYTGSYECSYNVRWYDAHTHAYIDDNYFAGCSYYRNRIEIVKLMWEEYFHYEEPKVIKRGYKYRRAHSNTLMFVYDKPVYDWKRWTYYSDGKRRVYAQKLASSKDRRIIRHWIKKGDWDAEIPTHPISKSVAWEIS